MIVWEEAALEALLCNRPDFCSFTVFPTMQKTALIKIDDKEIPCPVMIGTEGEKAIDARNLRKDSGYIFYDQGYGNTGSCESGITFLDGDNGILRHRGYPIEQLALYSDYVETAYLIIYGELPNQKQRGEFSHRLRDVQLDHPFIQPRRLQGFQLAIQQRRRHEMALARRDALFQKFTAAI